MTIRISFTDASDDQLKAFARDVLQIDKVPNARGAIIAAITQSGWDRDYISAPGNAPASDAEAAAAPMVEQVVRAGEQPSKMPTTGFSYWKDSPMVVCKIMSTDREGGNEPAHPIINGSPPLVIQRNKLVEIPYDFYLVLKQAGGTKMLPGKDVTDELVTQDYSEYPMTDIQLPSQAAVDAWNAKSAQVELGRPKADAA